MGLTHRYNTHSYKHLKPNTKKFCWEIIELLQFEIFDLSHLPIAINLLVAAQKLVQKQGKLKSKQWRSAKMISVGINHSLLFICQQKTTFLCPGV